MEEQSNVSAPVGAEVDVLVAGAGPVGLTLTCELERFGVGVRLVDGAPGRQVVSRATDLHARSLELWDHTGIADGILAAGLVITGVPLYSGGREVGRLDFGGVDSAFPAAISLRQHDLELLLAAHAATAVEWNAPVTIVGQDDTGVTARVGDDAVRAAYVVACDGVHSHIREALDIPFDGAEFPGRWVVMDATLEGWPYGPAELPVFLDHDGFWAMPLPGGWLRLFFRDDDAGPAPVAADGQAVIDRHVPGDVRIVTAENLACFQLHHRVARRFAAGRVLLAGDAAHAMTPVSGQGLNTGVQDAYNLAWKLRLAIDGAPSLVLDSYDAERRPVAANAVASSEATHEANVLTGSDAAARDRTLAAALATPAEVLASVTAGHELDVAYPDSPIVGPSNAAGAVGVIPGQRVPDAGPVVLADGTATSLRELMRHPGVQVWACVGTDPPDAALAVLAPIAGAVAVKVVVIADRPPPPRDGVEIVADPTLRVHGRLGALQDALFVVRPDGYLGARIAPPDLAALTEHLRQLGLRVGG
jgi:2-polyprenyl-6-methoxyphenol hydroxylase-like FAD-dependent oxidoreductase